MKEATEKITTIAKMIYSSYGYVTDMSIKEFLLSSHPQESSTGILAIEIYNYMTNSEFDEEEFTE